MSSLQRSSRQSSTQEMQSLSKRHPEASGAERGKGSAPGEAGLVPGVPPLSNFQVFVYSLGHVYNDLCAATWFSYLLVFLTYAARLSSGQAGVVMFSGQIADAVATPLVGLGSDATTGFPSLGLGKRKLWNLAGVLLVTLAYTFVFTVCLPCMMDDHPLSFTTDPGFQMSKTVALAIACAIFNLGWAAVQVSHMALVPELTVDDGKRVLLNAARYGNTILSNLIVFLTMFALLHTLDGGNNDNKGNADVYRDLALTVIALGGLCSLAFLLLLTERPPCELDTMLRFERAQARKKDAGDIAGAPRASLVSVSEDPESKRGVALRDAIAPPPPLAGASASGRAISTGSTHRKQSLADALLETLSTAGSVMDAHPVPGTAEVILRRCPRTGVILTRQRSHSFDGPTTPRVGMAERPASPASVALFGGRRAVSADPGRAVDPAALRDPSDLAALTGLAPAAGLSPVMDAPWAEEEEEEEYEEEGDPYQWHDWFGMRDFYLVGLNYMCTRVVVNISQVYLPFYVTATLGMNATSIALVPLLVYVASFLATLVSKPLNARLGRRLTYTLGTLLAGIACGSMLLLDHEHSYLVYPAAMVLGAGNAVLMVTTVSLEADLVGSGCTSGAFVYGAFSLLDKASNGGLILAIQFMQPEFEAHASEKSLFIRLVVAAVPLAAAVFGAFVTVVLIPTVLAKPVKPRTLSAEGMDPTRISVNSRTEDLTAPLL